MKTHRLLLGLSFSLLAAGCASQLPRPGVPLQAPYTSAEVERIMYLRDNGEGLADVARVVGGTRADVRAAERRELARRRGRRAEVAMDGAEPDMRFVARRTGF